MRRSGLVERDDDDVRNIGAARALEEGGEHRQDVFVGDGRHDLAPDGHAREHLAQGRHVGALAAAGGARESLGRWQQPVEGTWPVGSHAVGSGDVGGAGGSGEGGGCGGDGGGEGEGGNGLGS